MDGRDELLRSPWACPFCGSREADKERLNLHCLALHPIQYHIAKDLLAQQSKARPSARPAASSTKPSSKSLSSSRSRTSTHRRGSHHHKSSSGHGSIKRARDQGSRSHSSTSVHSTRLESRGSRDRRIKKEKKPRVDKPKSEPLSESVSSEAGRSDAESMRPTRCEHNRSWCTRFPRCLGRLCPQRHPDCPLGQGEGIRCLAANDCPFYHTRYEMACPLCPNRRRPEDYPPPLKHCPHRKIRPCQHGGSGAKCGKAALVCYYVHGECERLAETGICRPGLRCPFEHSNVFYFCHSCRLKYRRNPVPNNPHT